MLRSSPFEGVTMDRTRSRLIAALLVGALSVPAVAYVAGARGASGEDPVADSTTTKAPVAAPAADTAVSDLLLACGVDGETLVAGEAAGTLTAGSPFVIEAAGTNARSDRWISNEKSLASPHGWQRLSMTLTGLPGWPYCIMRMAKNAISLRH